MTMHLENILNNNKATITKSFNLKDISLNTKKNITIVLLMKV